MNIIPSPRPTFFASRFIAPLVLGLSLTVIVLACVAASPYAPPVYSRSLTVNTNSRLLGPDTNFFHTNIFYLTNALGAAGYSSGGGGSGQTASQVAAQIAASNLLTSAQVASQIASSNLITASQVAAQILASNHITAAQAAAQIAASNLLTAAQVATQIANSNLLTASQVAAQIAGSNLLTAAQVATQIAASNLASSASVLVKADTNHPNLYNPTNVATLDIVAPAGGDTSLRFIDRLISRIWGFNFSSNGIVGSYSQGIGGGPWFDLNSGGNMLWHVGWVFENSIGLPNPVLGGIVMDVDGDGYISIQPNTFANTNDAVIFRPIFPEWTEMDGPQTNKNILRLEGSTPTQQWYQTNGTPDERLVKVYIASGIWNVAIFNDDGTGARSIFKYQMGTGLTTFGGTNAFFGALSNYFNSIVRLNSDMLVRGSGTFQGPVLELTRLTTNGVLDASYGNKWYLFLTSNTVLNVNNLPRSDPGSNTAIVSLTVVNTNNYQLTLPDVTNWGTDTNCPAFATTLYQFTQTGAVIEGRGGETNIFWTSSKGVTNTSASVYLTGLSGSGQFLSVDGAGKVVKTNVPSSGAGGSGVANQLAYWLDANTLTNATGVIRTSTGMIIVTNDVAGTNVVFQGTGDSVYPLVIRAKYGTTYFDDNARIFTPTVRLIGPDGVTDTYSYSFGLGGSGSPGNWNFGKDLNIRWNDNAAYPNGVFRAGLEFGTNSILFPNAGGGYVLVNSGTNSVAGNLLTSITGASNGVFSVAQFYTNAATAVNWTSNNLFAGKVRLAASSQSYFITNALITSNACVLATINSDDTTATSVKAIPLANGVLQLKTLAAATADTVISWKIESR